MAKKPAAVDSTVVVCCYLISDSMINAKYPLGGHYYDLITGNLKPVRGHAGDKSINFSVLRGY